jgi:hypothetical protein
MPKPSVPSIPGFVASVPSGGGLISVAAPRPASFGPTGPTIRATPNGHATADTAGSDFVVLDEPKTTTVGMLYARDGDGKTHFGANFCPQPVVVIGLDGRGEREVKKALRKGRKVFYLDASTPFNVSQMNHEAAMKAAAESLELISRNYEWAVNKSIQEWGSGTLVIDTSKELSDIVRVMYKGRVDKQSDDFGKSEALINRTIKYFGERARQSNLNLILLARAKPIYSGREDTGRVTWDADKVFSQTVDWVVEYRKAAAGFAIPGVGLLGAAQVPGIVSNEPTYEILVTNPKLAHGEQGAVYRQAEWEAAGVGPFAYMCERLIPGSVAEDWT